MERLIPGLLVTALAVLILLAMVWAWRGRRRRQSAFAAPAEVPAVEARGAELARASVLYVATTKAGEPLERLTIPGLAFRARGEAAVYERGVLISLPGEPETFVPRDAVRSIGTSTWAIDRVVETGGLVRLDWTYPSTDGPAEVESYLRATELGDARRLIDAANSIIPQQEGTSS
ncbi:hypothetical protein SCB71_10195 [Herbiconiux sp. KACC 21604]|uniref:PH-like domain-containing protein n=1 Tax=unclassified Herbiconiux TaxID=2618217 RepID=UPI0014931CDF|nr:hypothetical protein [Herbiconiux sp. SALV-R1]QJU53606.1 hypothetical protein HL652_08150 [Herbiconiux sp. SALV-R1]WPO88588.1 hypothetical protein SCB71_10195 [Herbiconiux sp. KACC 21604]